MNVSLFKTIRTNEGNDNPVTFHVDRVLAAIKNGRYKDVITKIRAETNKDARDKIKRDLTAVTFSGVFKTRKVRDFKEASNLVCLDFDKMSISEMNDLRLRLVKDKHVYSVFVSPSGKGLKVLVRANFNSADEYKQSFYAIDRHFGMNKYFDMSTSDISRATFVSYDPDTYLNANAEVFEEKVDNISTYGENRAVSSPEGVLRVLEKWRNNKGDYYADGNRDNFIFKVAGGMSRYGVQESDTMALFGVKYPDYPKHELSRAVKSAYRSSDFGVSDILDRNEDDFNTFVRKLEVPDFGFNPEDVISNKAEVNQRVIAISEGNFNSDSWGCQGIDDHLPLRSNELYAFVAASKSGKTLGVSYLAAMAAQHSNYRGIILTTESSIEDYKYQMCSFLLDRPLSAAHNEDIVAALKFIDEHFTFLNNDLDHIQILEVYHYLHAKGDYYNFIIIDPISNVSKSKKIASKNNGDYHEALYVEYLKFTKKYCSLWVVSHVVTDKERERTVPYVMDAEFGSYLRRRVDYGVAFYRDVYNEMERHVMEMHVRDVRSSLTKGGDTTNSDNPILMKLYASLASFRYDVWVNGDVWINPLLNGNSKVSKKDLI